MRPDDPSLLLDMLIAARRVAAYVQGASEEDFAAQRVLQDAVVYRVQTIGEAASQVSP